MIRPVLLEIARPISHREKDIYILKTSTTSWGAATLIAGLFALTGCSGDASSQATQDATSAPSSPSSQASQHAEQEKTGYIDQTINSDTGKPRKNTFSKTVGKPHWAVYQTGAGIDAATEEEIGEKAEAFIRDHVLRTDRWATDWMVQPGELDAYAEKTTPRLAKNVAEDVMAAHDLFNEYGPDAADWPKKDQKRVEEFIGSISDIMLNSSVELGGKGDLLFRVTERQLFRASREKGWGGAYVGQPVSWYVVEETRQNGTGGSNKFGIHQMWRKVRGEWLVDDAGWKTID